LINGKPFSPEDQDDLTDLLTITTEELNFWNNVGISPDHIYDIAEPGWEEHIN
jgi:hypothetical protein